MCLNSYFFLFFYIIITTQKYFFQKFCLIFITLFVIFKNCIFICLLFPRL
ncbi:unnamed protein product [Meloidogyne enterolobii]|uniref:Uncharacterized protein n=1 Tax=Meloidogyne enterolobii TaxID=390850 RepID=A0ACB0YHW7_MELEN